MLLALLIGIVQCTGSMEPFLTCNDTVELHSEFNLTEGEVYVHKSPVSDKLIVHRYLFTTRNGLARFWMDGFNSWYDVNPALIEYKVGEKI